MQRFIGLLCRGPALQHVADISFKEYKILLALPCIAVFKKSFLFFGRIEKSGIFFWNIDVCFTALFGPINFILRFDIALLHLPEENW